MIQIRIRESVWYDYLDPLASGMAESIGLERPAWFKRRAVFMVTPEQARRVRDYLQDRAVTLLSQSHDSRDPDDRRERATHRRALEDATQIDLDLAGRSA